MVYGAYLEGYRHVDDIIKAIGDVYDEYNWLITVSEGYGGNEELFPTEYGWLTGEELGKSCEKKSETFIWCVISAFNKSIQLNNILEYKLPYADGNSRFWVDNVELQTPYSQMEIVFFDGTACFLLSKKQEHISGFLSAFPDSYDLIEDNRKSNAIFRIIKAAVLKENANSSNNEIDKISWKIYHMIFNNIATPIEWESTKLNVESLLKQAGYL